MANPASIIVTQDAPLRFGSFVVPSSGSRQVTASGMVTNQSIIDAHTGPTGPAQFTIAYDRGNQSRRMLDIQIEVVLFGVPQVTVGGVSARLSSFDTDIPGVSALTPGQAVTISLRNCITRVCSTTFHIGGRLDVTRSYGGAVITVPLPISATVVAVN